MSAAPPHPSTREAAAWKALADPTRRRILDDLRVRPRTTRELAEGFDMTRFGVMKHLKVLEAAELVRVERKGRERWNHLNAVPIQEIHRRWIRPFEAGPADALLQIRATVEAAQTRTQNQTQTQTRSKTDTSNEDDPMTAATQDATFGVVNITVEISIEATAERCWKALIEDTRWWWHKDFYTGPNPRRFVIEPELGGRMYEDWGDGQGLVWARVAGLARNAELRVTGQLFPEFGGPAANIMTIRLAEEGCTTKLTLTECMYGDVGAKEGAANEEGWRFLFEKAFKPYVETGSRAEIPATVE